MSGGGISNRLATKIVLVTGAVGGIGQSIVRLLAAEGATVIAADLDVTGGAVLAAEISGSFLKLDVTNENQWVATLAEVERNHGRLDGLVNNAGLVSSRGGEDPENVQIDDLRRLFQVNVEGVALGCKHAIPVIARAGGGSIVNMSSVAALVPSDFIVAYAASKAAVKHWTRSVALHCTRKNYAIRCNSVHPGSVLTPMMSHVFDRLAAGTGITLAEAEETMRKMIPMGKYQEPIDIANAVLFLLSDESRFITGQPLIVDGGMELAL